MLSKLYIYLSCQCALPGKLGTDLHQRREKVQWNTLEHLPHHRFTLLGQQNPPTTITTHPLHPFFTTIESLLKGSEKMKNGLNTTRHLHHHTTSLMSLTKEMRREIGISISLRLFQPPFPDCSVVLKRLPGRGKRLPFQAHRGNPLNLLGRISPLRGI